MISRILEYCGMNVSGSEGNTVFWYEGIRILRYSGTIVLCISSISAFGYDCVTGLWHSGLMASREWGIHVFGHWGRKVLMFSAHMALRYDCTRGIGSDSTGALRC